MYDTSLHSSENVEVELEEAGGEVIFRVNEGSFGQDMQQHRSIDEWSETRAR